jgi:hypothetical protein
MRIICTMYIIHILHIKIEQEITELPSMSPKKTSTKTIRLHILIDEPLRKSLSLAAHDSWMSVGQYIRETVDLFKGVCYDDAADLVMIGREVGLDGLEKLREAALRRNISINELCLTFGRGKSVDEVEKKNAEKINQISLFGDE